MAWVLTWVWFLFCFQSYFEEITEGQTTFDVNAVQSIKSCCFNPSENPVGNFSVPQFLTCGIIANTISFLHPFVNLAFLHKKKKKKKKSPIQEYTTLSLAAEQIKSRPWKAWKLCRYFLSFMHPMVQAEHPADYCSHDLQSLGGLRYLALSLTSTEPDPDL